MLLKKIRSNLYSEHLRQKMENVCRANNNNYIAIHHLKIKRRKAAASRSKWGSQPFSARERKRKCIEMLERERTKLEEWLHTHTHTHTHTYRQIQEYAHTHYHTHPDSRSHSKHTVAYTNTNTYKHTHSHSLSHRAHTPIYPDTWTQRERNGEREGKREECAFVSLSPHPLISPQSYSTSNKILPKSNRLKTWYEKHFSFPFFFEPETLF